MKKKLFRNFVYPTKTLTKDFCHKKAQSVIAFGGFSRKN